MTNKPDMTLTEAQIDAAWKAMRELAETWNDDAWDWKALAKAARTAAAEVGEDATIERCAQVADNFKFLPEHSKGVQAIVAMTIAAAIRALKDKP